jgi:hypothetical protein
MSIEHEQKTAVAPGKPGSEIYPKSPLGISEQGIATGRDVNWQPLVDYRRNGCQFTSLPVAIPCSDIPRGDFG